MLVITKPSENDNAGAWLCRYAVARRYRADTVMLLYDVGHVSMLRLTGHLCNHVVKEILKTGVGLEKNRKVLKLPKAASLYTIIKFSLDSLRSWFVELHKPM